MCTFLQTNTKFTCGFFLVFVFLSLSSSPFYGRTFFSSCYYCTNHTTISNANLCCHLTLDDRQVQIDFCSLICVDDIYVNSVLVTINKHNMRWMHQQNTCIHTRTHTHIYACQVENRHFVKNDPLKCEFHHVLSLCCLLVVRLFSKCALHFHWIKWIRAYYMRVYAVSTMSNKNIHKRFVIRLPIFFSFRWCGGIQLI